MSYNLQELRNLVVRTMAYEWGIVTNHVPKTIKGVNKLFADNPSAEAKTIIKSWSGGEDVEVTHPVSWSELAVSVAQSRYARDIKEVSYKETSVFQICERLTRGWFGASGQNALTVTKDYGVDEGIVYSTLLLQMWAPNSPQWFNTGIYEMTGFEGQDINGYWTADVEPVEVAKRYQKSAPHACFIQSVSDSLTDEGGIMDTLANETRLFRNGAGTGSNFSALREFGAPLSGGGTSSGIMSFLKVLDSNAGAIKSGGTTRRAAKMVILDADHPDIMKFMDWKVEEEYKVAALSVGSNILADQLKKDGSFQKAVKAGVPESYAYKFFNQIEDDFLPVKKYDTSWTGEGYRTVDGQNSNNSVRLTDRIMSGDDVVCRSRVTGKVVNTYTSEQMINKIAECAWLCADPGIQFTDTINAANTCPNDGAINGSNPCSEYFFLDDTACNLASINLMKFRLCDGVFDYVAFREISELITCILDVSIDISMLPTKKIAQGTANYRTIGLGYANLGSLLMSYGAPYGSDYSIELTEEITKTMHAAAVGASATLAEILGPFPRFDANATEMRKVVESQLGGESIEGFGWCHDISQVKFRNAQFTVLAPTGTIGLVMGCDTTGIEPDYSLVRHKSLADGNTIRIVSESMRLGLDNIPSLYSDVERDEVVAYVVGYETGEHLPERFSALRGISRGSAQNIDELLKGNSSIKESDKEFLDTYFFGHGTVVGCPLLSEEDMEVFRCAAGDFVISPYNHLLVMSAAQKYLSGGISKTINLPAEESVSTIVGLIKKAHRMGIKAISIYRDESKLSQPLSAASRKKVAVEEVVEPVTVQATRTVSPLRLRVPSKRKGYTQTFKVGGHKVYLRTGEFEDGSLGEIFLSLKKDGGALSAILSAFSISISLNLQHGVPLEHLCSSFIGMKFEPAGFVQEHDYIKMGKSILDVVFRDLAINYLGMTEYANVVPDSDSFGYEEELPTLVKSLPSSFLPDACPECNQFTMVSSGTCTRCTKCGATTGCS